MGGSIGGFSGACMYDFQVTVAGYKIQHGIPEETEAMTTDDLDDLYAGIAGSVEANPEVWH